MMSISLVLIERVKGWTRDFFSGEEDEPLLLQLQIFLIQYTMDADMFITSVWQKTLACLCSTSLYLLYCILSAKQFQILCLLFQVMSPGCFSGLFPSLQSVYIPWKSKWGAAWPVPAEPLLALPSRRRLPDASWLSFLAVWEGYLAFTQRCNIVDSFSSLMHNKPHTFCCNYLIHTPTFA